MLLMYKIMLIFIISSYINAIEPISPIPQKVDDVDIKKALLGKELFFDTILSRDNSTACVSCHNVYSGGADVGDVSFGFKHKAGNINSPTVLNSRYNFTQFWNGRAKDLKEQADGPINNPVEHNMNKTLVEKRLNNSQKYQNDFFNIYKTKKIDYDDVLDAIVEFEKALITPNAKFDKFLRGEEKLTKDEEYGYKLFKHYGCITCHNGINIGSNSFQKFGTLIEYKSNTNYPDRSAVTNSEVDKNVFKVPTLRNIVLTAPYFHDGSAKTLDEVIQKMAIYNLGLDISDKDIHYIKKFLETLTGETPKILDIK